MDAFRSFLKSTARLVPDHAVAAIIVVDDAGYLLQHRDEKPSIFFPGRWGCFGGAVEPDESDEAALVRELDEELSLELSDFTATYFTNFDFDFGYAGYGVLHRRYFELRIDAKTANNLQLGEGQAMSAIPTLEVMTMQNLVPYDAYALWMHFSQQRLRKP